MNCIRRYAFVAVGSALVCTSFTAGTVAIGQELEEIVVTARKREESLQEIPVAISAFTADQLVDIGARNLVDVAAFTPGLQFNEQGVQEPGRLYTAIRFRGLGSEIKEPFGQVGSAFLDGIYMSSGVSSVGTENIDRIEVVKGPSSAWLGRSTFAGAVNIITKTPSLTEYSGRVTASFAQDETFEVSAAHEGPIIENKLGYRVFASSYTTGGQYTASDGGALGQESTDTIMATLYGEPGDRLSWRFRAMYSQDDDGPPPGLLISGPFGLRGNNTSGLTNCLAQNPSWANLFKSNEPAFGNLTDFVCGEIPFAPGLIDGNTQLEPEFLFFWENVVPQIGNIPDIDNIGIVREQTRFMFNLDYELPFGPTLSFLAGDDAEYVVSIRDFDNTPANNWLSRDPQIIDYNQYELRLTSQQDQKFTWLVGVSYFDAKFSSQFSGGEVVVGGDGGIGLFGTFDAAFDLDVILGGVTDGSCPCGFVPLDPPPQTFGETTGIFGSLGYQITDELSVDFEWRWQEDEIRGRTTATPGFADPNSVVFAETQPFILDAESGLLGFDTTTFLPRLTVQYQLSDQSNFWATYSEGNNPGFFNLDLVSRSAADLRVALDQIQQRSGNPAKIFVDEEEINNLEFGWKQIFGDGRISFSAVAYAMEWTNQKTRTGIPVTRPNGSQFSANTVVDGFTTDLKGIEFEGIALINENLSFDFSINWADAEFKDFDCGFTDDFAPAGPDGNLSCDGNRPVQFPEWSGAVAGTWTDQLSGNWDYFVRVDTTYRSKRFVDEKNFAYIGAQTLVNLRAGFQSENLRIEGFVTNLFDDDTYLAGNRWSDFSATQGTLFPFEFTLQQGIALTAPKQRQVGVRAALDF